VDAITLKSSKVKESNSSFESLKKLIQIIRNDPLINEKVIEMLNMESYQRRNVLNRWLEQLRRKSASENLRQALSCLFDDKIAKKVLTLINSNHH
jgi:hypothetical protein